MQQQYTMSSEDKMIMKTLEVTFISILGCIERQQEKPQMKSLTLTISYTSYQG